jgi:hypothetical protein
MVEVGSIPEDSRLTEDRRKGSSLNLEVERVLLFILSQIFLVTPTLRV